MRASVPALLAGIRWGAAGLCLVAAALLGWTWFQDQGRPPDLVLTRGAPSSGELSIDVSGAVVSPGLIRLPPGSRIGDALAAAGGPQEAATLEGINQALLLVDGQRVYVPQAGVTPPAGVVPASALVNLNTGSQRELMALPGIGEVRARAIIAWREANGPFARPDDLVTYQLITPTVFQGLRDRVAVE